MSEREENRVKNEDEINESHKSQLKFDYEVYLLNYTIKYKNLKNLNWAFQDFKCYKPKKPRLLKPFLQP